MLERPFNGELVSRWAEVGWRILLVRRKPCDGADPEQLFAVDDPVAFGDETVVPGDPFLDFDVGGLPSRLMPHNVGL